MSPFHASMDLCCLQYFIIGYIHINIACFTLFLNGLRWGDMIVWLFKIKCSLSIAICNKCIKKPTVAVFTGTEKQL